MRTSWKLGLLVLAGLTTGATIGHAEGFFSKAFHGFSRDAQRNNAWPEPFIPGDRARVRAPMQQCIVNGYRTQNTMGDYYFEEDTGHLKANGADKIYSILTETPAQFRCIFVVRAETPELTAARILAVQQVADKIVEPGELAQVAETPIKVRTAPAYYIDAVDRAWRETTPSPRLPQAVGRGGASGGGSASGAGS